METEFEYENIPLRKDYSNLLISGKIDESVVIGEMFKCPVYTVEDKKMDIVFSKKLDGLTRSAIGQACFHMVCGVTKISTIFQVTFPDFFGALINGRQWIFLRMDSRSSSLLFFGTEPITVVSEDGVIDELGIVCVTKYLLLSLQRTRKFVCDHELVDRAPETAAMPSRAQETAARPSRAPLAPLPNCASGRVRKASGTSKRANGGSRSKLPPGHVANARKGLQTSNSFGGSRSFPLNDENLFIHSMQFALEA